MWRTTNRHKQYLIVLTLGSGLLALVMAVLLVLQLMQNRVLENVNRQQMDSVTFLTFQFEREFLRMRHQVILASIQKPIDTYQLQLRYDILISRLVLLRDSPTLAILAETQEFQQILPKLLQLLDGIEPTIRQERPVPRDLARIVTLFDALGPDAQRLSYLAAERISTYLEQKNKELMHQNQEIIWLTITQLVILVLATISLALRQRAQEKDRQALEALTEELRQARWRAETANKGKSQFLANMSHELRTPFNGMLGMLSLLENTQVSATQADYIQTAKASAQHLLTVLNDILDISALESGKMQIRPEAVQLPNLLRDVERLMRPHASGKNIQFVASWPDDLPTWIQCDPTRLKQILFNLLSNAIKFTEQGSVKLTVTCEPANQTLHHFTFTVEDTGIGMNHEAVEKLFQRFYQADGGMARKFGGTGLGLEISRSLARMMGGDIAVHSVEGQGSTFRLDLDLHMVEAPAQAKGNPLQGQLTAPNKDPKCSPLRVLVAEDHPVNRKFVGILLEKLGCETTFCENGELAVQAVQDSDFDIILMDVHMPVMDGLAATRAIRAMEAPKNGIPIVVLTADVMNEAQDQALAAGVNDFVGKPVQISQLKAAMQRCLTTPSAQAPT
ncbi:ATP-binding protein [Curvibacter sp. CHRR-16]|uniref:ATP-binding protein n=1 Tax=Curvibacter sp. CHRR-16 TaxID=2835872 RepID=UPI002023B4D1|nr:ATP-binding protein [Curvibacter sp. CHRR-16]